MVGVGDVARDRDDAVETADRALERVPVARVDDEPPAALGERAREREPEAARGAGDDGLHCSGLDRHAVARDDPVVVEPQQLDHVEDVVLVLDPARREARLAGEDGVIVDPALLLQLVPDALREAEVRRVVAVQVPDLLAADREDRIRRGCRCPPRRRGQEVTSSVMTVVGCTGFRHETPSLTMTPTVGGSRSRPPEGNWS